MYTLAAESKTDCSITRRVSRAAKTLASAARVRFGVWALSRLCDALTPTDQVFNGVLMLIGTLIGVESRLVGIVACASRKSLPALAFALTVGR